jgi:hypothetical protein
MTSNHSSSNSTEELNKEPLSFKQLLGDSAKLREVMEPYKDQAQWAAVRVLMGAVRSSHLEALAYSDDLEEQKRHAVIVSFLTQNFLSDNGIMEWLIEEKAGLTAQRNAEKDVEGSAFMEPDSGTFDEQE